MINYIRTHNTTAEQIMSASKAFWSDDAYLKPVLVDFWLMFGKNGHIERGKTQYFASIQRIFFFLNFLIIFHPLFSTLRFRRCGM